MRYDAISAPAIEAIGLAKRFGETTALAGVDLVARQGRVLGVLGPNGAGKTTAVRILATLLRPDGGQASVCGYDVLRDAYRVRQLIGLTGQYASVDEGLSGTNNLIMIGRLLGLPRAQARARAAELLARFELTDAAGRIVKTYSGGMRRRLDLAASLIGRPRVLFLDEPTTGLDPRSRTDVWVMIRGLVADGVTVLLTTQYLANGVFDRFRSLPIARSAPLAGAILGDMVRYSISVAVTLGFGMILRFRITTSPLAAVAACLLLLVFALAMCWFSALIGLLVKTPQAVQWFGFLAMFPLVFGSNLLVPSSTMPGWLQAFVKVNPITYLTEAERGLLTGGPVATPAIRSLLWALGIFVVFAPLAVRVYRRKT